VPGSTEVVYVVLDSEDEDDDMVSESFSNEVDMVRDPLTQELDMIPASLGVQVKEPDSLTMQVDKKSDSVKSMLTPEQVRALYEQCNGDVIKFMFDLMHPELYSHVGVRNLP
jgi:hypothetical protein